MTNREQLKHALMMKMGLPPGHPTDAEFQLVIQQISRIRTQRGSTSDDWRKACERYVPGAGSHIYAAEDTSDLDMLLDRLLGS